MRNLQAHLLGSTILRNAAGAASGAVAPPQNQGQQQQAPAPFAALPADVTTFLTGQGVADVPTLATKFKEATTRLGGSIELPKPDATPEIRQKFYEKTRPAAEADYKFDLPQGLPEGFQYDGDLAKAARTAFYGLGLDAHQAKGVHDWFVNHMGGQFKATVEQTVAAENAAHAELVKSWGADDSDAYKTNMQLAGRAASKLGIMDSLKAAGLLSPDGGIKDAAIAKALATVGGTLYKEDSTPAGGGGNTGVNPWAKETWNETQQGEVFKADKTRARSLMQAAGINPADYGL